MNQEQIEERLRIMRAQENSSYCCSDYLQDQTQKTQGSQQPKNNDTIDQTCRFKMAEWCFTVIDYIKFRRETVSIAMDYLDRFLCSGCPRAQQVITSRKEYQLAAMTTLFMAIKINEPVIIDISFLKELSKGVYTSEDFKKMETDILFGLKWRVNGPTSQSFVVHLLTLMQQRMPASSTNPLSPSVDYTNLLELATHKIELSVGEYKLMTQKASVIATASIWSCVEEAYPNNIFRREFFDMISDISFQSENVLQTKECLGPLRNNSTMEMRSSMSSLIEVVQQSSPKSPRSTIASAALSDKDSHSPICVSKRNLVQ
jgi:hypothetical protein